LAKKKTKEKRTPLVEGKKAKPPKFDLFGEDSLPKWAIILFALLALYLFNAFIFPSIVFDDYDFLLGGDNLAAAPIAKMGTDFLAEGEVPNWCPYIFGGMPMVGSLMFANHYYWAFVPAIRDLVSLLFFGSDFGWLFIHYILAGFGIFFLLRTLGVHWIFALLCGMLYAYNPTMVVYADVGHGSKVMTIAYLPWILYFIRQLYHKPGPGWAAGLALFFGALLLALHVQIAYYGAMLIGLYVVYSFITGGKTDFIKNIRASFYLIAAAILAFGISATLYFQVFEYSEFSQRGGGLGGGAPWDYATAWSFHPLESLSYVFPSFYGYGGSTYWGFMPFTDMSVYWGGLALLFAPLAIVLKRDRFTIFLIVLAAAAWIVSFGKFLPILYYPLYELLPYFNKFRVPSLIQSLVLLSAVVLAGRGLQALWQLLKTGDSKGEEIGRKLLVSGGIIAGICLLIIILQGALKSTFIAWILSARPQMQPQDAAIAFGMFIGDCARLLGMVVVLYGSAALALMKKAPAWVFAAAAVLVVILEVNHFDKSLIHPTPPQHMDAYLQADDVVGFLQKETEPFRVFPLTGSRNPDWYMQHRIESVDGYSASKMKLYHIARDSITQNNPNFLKLMNVKYFITDRPINHPDFMEVFVGGKERVYQYQRAFPRAFLLNQAVQVASDSEIFDLYRRGNFDFSKVAVIQDNLSGSLDPKAEGSVKWLARSPDHLELEVETNGRQLLFLSEVYYPSGWTATLDGVEVPVIRTNYMFRGVEIPAGKHILAMSYMPLSAGRGVIFKWISVLIILAGFAIAYFQKRRSSSTHMETADEV